MPDIVTTWLDGHELKTEYDIEYIADRKNWELVCSDRHPAPWELYEHKRMENFSDAMAWYCTAMFRADILDVKMMESTYIDGKLVRERSFDLPWWFMSSMEMAVGHELHDQIGKLEEQHREDSSWITDATEYLEKYNAMRSFREFRNNRVNSDFT